MTKETTTPGTEANSINISIEQICASIINTIGSVEVPIENLLAKYEGKSIAVNQDPDTKSITFTLADIPAESQENSQETE